MAPSRCTTATRKSSIRFLTARVFTQFCTHCPCSNKIHYSVPPKVRARYVPNFIPTLPRATPLKTQFHFEQFPRDPASFLASSGRCYSSGPRDLGCLSQTGFGSVTLPVFCFHAPFDKQGPRIAPATPQTTTVAEISLS